MAIVFTLIFFAAIVGVFKPYINGMKRSYFVAAALGAFVLVGVTAPPTPNTSAKAATDTAAAKAATATSNDTAGAPAADAAAPTASNWEYQNSKDEMRGTSSEIAQVTSDNTVDLDFPYGEVHGQLWLRKRKEDGLNAAFEVENGQVLCNSFEESHISVKFDDGPIRKFSCTDASDGSNNVAFIENARGFLADLRKSKRVTVEAEFFQAGRKQFTFQTAGLNWN